MHVAEILVDHPDQSIIDQVDRLYVRKVVSGTDYSALVRTIHDERHLLDDPLTAALTIALSDERTVCVRKYILPDGEAGQRVRIEKRQFATPDEEIWFHIRQRQEKHPSLTDDQAQRQVMAEHPDLWERHTQSQRAGVAHPPPVAKQAERTYDEVLAEADALVAKTGGTTRRDALMALAQAHPAEPAYYRAYRKYHLGQGQADAVLGEQRQG